MEKKKNILRDELSEIKDLVNVFEVEMQNYRLQTLAYKIKTQTFRPKQKMFFY